MFLFLSKYDSIVSYALLHGSVYVLGFAIVILSLFSFSFHLVYIYVCVCVCCSFFVLLVYVLEHSFCFHCISYYTIYYYSFVSCGSISSVVLVSSET